MCKMKERGAIVVEATISLTAFVFAIFLLLLLVNIYYIQSRISVALNTAAKELSEYSYMYFKLGGDGISDKLHEGTEESLQTSKNTIKGVATMFSELDNASSSAQDYDFEGALDSLGNAYDSGSATAKELADKISEDPKGFIIGMGYMAVDQGAHEAMTALCKVICKAFMQKNLIATKNDTADAFLRRYHVDGGLDGLDFNYTTYLPPEKKDYIQVVVSYDVKVIRLLNLEYKFSFRQCSKTLAWARGVSKIHPETNMQRSGDGSNIWDANPLDRGQWIVNQEKKNYEYRSSGLGFDAFDSKNNRFYSIVSRDPNSPTYQGEQGYKNLLNSIVKDYNDLVNKVEDLPSPITMLDQAGNSVEVPTDPGSRQYTLEVVMPDNTSDELIQQLVNDAKAKGITIVIKKGYGSPSVQDNDGN